MGYPLRSASSASVTAPMPVTRTISTDVLIVGAGGAALRAALAAGEAGARVTIVVKGRVGRSGATVSPDSPAVAWQVADGCAGDDDSPEVHARNILDAGLGMADPALAHLLAIETIEETARLEGWGLRFIPDPARPAHHYSGYSCFGDRPRAHGIANSGAGHAGDVVRVLLEQLRRRPPEMHEEVTISDLIVADGRCAGAVGLGPAGEVFVYQAGAVVLAAGGARQIFPQEPGRTRIDTTGDSYAMALRAGAELANLEFTQYMLHPVPPFPVVAPGVFWALCPTLRNRHGDEALAPYLPPGVTARDVMRQRTEHYPFSTRDQSRWLDLAFASELRAGRGTAEGGLYLDFSAVNPVTFEPSRPQHVPEDCSRPIKLPARLVQVRPAAHAVNGGVLIDARAASSLPGLFAVAEAAAGPHGADRLGGCMVSNGQVFGARAGRFAAEHAADCRGLPLPAGALEPALARLRRSGGGRHDPDEVLARLQAATGRHLVVLRHQSGLTTLLERIRELEEELPAPGAEAAPARRRRILEVANAITTAGLMAEAARSRTESRGSHYREDFPRQDDAHWRTCLVFHHDGAMTRTRTRALERAQPCPVP